MGNQKRSYRLYNVYNNKTDEPVAIYATSEGAARALGISKEQFMCVYSRRYKKWHIDAIPVTFAERMKVLKREREDRGEKMPNGCHVYRVYLTHNGKTQTIRKWAEETGIPDRVIYRRKIVSCWEDDKTLTVPLMERGGWRDRGTKRDRSKVRNKTGGEYSGQAKE